MNEFKKNSECRYCGGKEGLVFESNGEVAIVRHETPFQCIVHLQRVIGAMKKRMGKIDAKTAGLDVFGG
jgi:hypothetical protein